MSMQVFLDRRQRDVDDGNVHGHDEKARAADRKDQVGMRGGLCGDNIASAPRACSRKRSILSSQQGLSTSKRCSPCREDEKSPSCFLSLLKSCPLYPASCETAEAGS